MCGKGFQNVAFPPQSVWKEESTAIHIMETENEYNVCIQLMSFCTGRGAGFISNHSLVNAWDLNLCHKQGHKQGQS